jgi:sialate O-acetylesterase
MKSFFRISISLIVWILTIPSFGQLKLPAVIGDNMVLQQKSEVAIWGWGDPGSEIKVSGSWNNDTVKAKISNQSQWKVKIRTPAAGGPFTLSIRGNEMIILRNVMIGEVWICSGQSNMEWNADLKINNAEEEIKNANHPEIRFSWSNDATGNLFSQEGLPVAPFRTDDWKY